MACCQSEKPTCTFGKKKSLKTHRLKGDTANNSFSSPEAKLMQNLIGAEM